MPCTARGMAVVVFLAVVAGATNLCANDAAEFFESRVRPLLVEHCFECHGPETQTAGLRLDSRDGLLSGGDSGPAIVPGDAQASLLIRAVRRSDDIAMPPDDPLTEEQIELLVAWINAGAVWPEDDLPTAASIAERTHSHWAFRPLRVPEIPSPSDFGEQAQWVRTPVDAFILAKLQAAGLTPAQEADRATLIRRVYVTVTGLPPTYDEVAQFVADPDPRAYERLVDRILDSPHYGEQWARHWLDVARYSDTKGYVYDREERFWIHAWTYRDWVVRALNQDMPYNRFLLLQLAADQVDDRAPGDLAAMGFLTIGRRFLGVKHDVIDDRIDVVCRGTMGLTVTCARCHDHKYDPIPTADYYSLYGIFDSSMEKRIALTDTATQDREFRDGLLERQTKLEDKTRAYRKETADRARKRIVDYLHAQTELDKYPAEGFDQILQPDDLLPAYVRQWEAYLRKTLREKDPVFAAWHAYAALDASSFAAEAPAVTEKLQTLPATQLNPLVARAFADAPSSFDDVVQRYGALLLDIDRQWKAAVERASHADPQHAPSHLDDPAAEQLRAVLYGPNAPCEVPGGTIVTTETFFTTNRCEELWRLHGDVDRWILQAGERAPYALALVDRSEPREPRIFRRGNAARKGKEVPRQFLTVLSGGGRQPFVQGSGRWELAQAIVHPDNPLTARVMVNRVWAHYFGQGLVLTPSDFGTRAEPPSHPELLDWLASRFIAHDWKLKDLHRLLLLSSTFRQAGRDELSLAASQRAMQVDPDNRWLWHVTSRRLNFEQTRDALLAVTGDLQRELGGKPMDMFQSPFMRRRALYGLVDRQFLPGTLRTFDFANPDLHTPQRSETTVPQQSLFFMNHPFVLQQARRLAARSEHENSPERRLRVMFQHALLREPTEQEIREGLAWLEHPGDSQSAPSLATATDWQYGYGAWDESSERVVGFTALPHFTGQAWQGGEDWPDDALGWVQLTATGGHPGNDREHAAVRRWIAPRSMTLAVRSELVHDASEGDGIRAFVVSSRQGLLASAAVHQQTATLNVDTFDVQAGEALDFVVDIGDVLNSDQYQWPIKIAEDLAMSHADREATTWNSQNDFTRDTVTPLTAWEQLAHVLLCTNEFLYVD